MFNILLYSSLYSYSSVSERTKRLLLDHLETFFSLVEDIKQDLHTLLIYKKVFLIFENKT